MGEALLCTWADERAFYKDRCGKCIQNELEVKMPGEGN